MSGTMNATEFAKAMRVTVPKSIHARGKKAFLIVATSVHRELTLGARVYTGYMRASIAASTEGVPFPPIPPKPIGKGSTPKPLQFAPLWPRSQAQAAGAIAVAVKKLTRLQFAFGAPYAQYPTTGAPELVQRVKAKIPGMIRDAITRAQHLTAGEAAD